jgi:hypothetical protein
MKDRLYRVTFLNCFSNLLNAIVVTIAIAYVLLMFISKVNLTEIKIGWIVILMLIIIWIGFGLYPLYVFIIYYRHDKKVHIKKVNNDNDTYVIYMYDNKIIQTVKLKDIIRIEQYRWSFIFINYYIVVINNQESIILSSLFSVSSIFGKVKRVTIKDRQLIPYEWKNGNVLW